LPGRTVRQRSLLERVFGVLRLDAATFEEIEHDESATNAAIVVALLVGVSMGIRTGLFELIAGEQGNWVWAVGLGASIGLLYAVFGLFALTLFTTGAFLIGGRLLRLEVTEVTWTQLFRTLGFSGILVVILVWAAALHPVLYFAVGLWFLAAVVVSVRQSLEFGTGRAIVTTLLSSLFAFIVLSVAFFLLSMFLVIAIFGLDA
jgi:hypothetical protein